MTTPTMGIVWPTTGATVPTIITYSFAEEPFESLLQKSYSGYPALDSGLTPEQIEVFEQALGVWEQAAGVDFVRVGDTPWVSLRVGTAALEGAGNVLGVTMLWPSGTTITKTAVAFDQLDIATATTATIPPPRGVVSFYQLSLHEIGHVLGLDHSAVPNDLMYPYANRTVSLSDDTTAAVASLYGDPKTIAAPAVVLAEGQAQVQKCYIAYYGRPADPAGLNYWVDQLDKAGGNLSAIINDFANAPESHALYGSLSTAQVVTTLYDQLFGRSPEQEGLQYWSTLLDNGALSRQSIMITLLNGAQNTDAVVVNNKLSAAALFTGSVMSGYGEEDIQDVRTWLSGVTTESPYQEAVTAAITAIGVNLPATWEFGAG